MSERPNEFERPISPRPVFRSEPASQATPVRGDQAAEPAPLDWASPPTAAPGGRFARPADRYEIPIEQAPEEVQPFNWRRLISSLVVVVVVGVVAGWAYVRFLYDPAPDDDTVVQISQSAGPRMERPDQLVREYLNALAAGDTTTALSLGAVGSGDPSAISPEAYAVSLLTYPITDIQVPQIDTATTEVPASYRIGDQQVNTRFRVVRDDSGSWQLAHATVQVELQKPTAPDLPVRLNGVVIPGGVAEVLPGHYQVSTGLPFVDYPQASAVAITNLEYDGLVQRQLTPVLTPQGREALLAAGQASLSDCLAAASLTPAGCPNQLTAPAPYDPGSVQWTLVVDPFTEANPALDPADQSRGLVSMVLRLQVGYNYTGGGANPAQTLAAQSVSYSSSLLAEDGEALVVTWS